MLTGTAGRATWCATLLDDLEHAVDVDERPVDAERSAELVDPLGQVGAGGAARVVGHGSILSPQLGVQPLDVGPGVGVGRRVVDVSGHVDQRSPASSARIDAP